MSTFQAMLAELRRNPTGKAHQRLIDELDYAGRISALEGNAHREALERTLRAALEQQRQHGAITLDFVHEAENALSALSASCKQYRWLLVGHAHIDMNWMWRYDETAAVVLDTFRTMLRLMEKHPGFRFAQSQASTYAIVEAYEPEMLEEIKRRIREGRWEVTASSWVEADHNMPSLESELRHLLYTKRYLSGLLGVSESALDLDFEPDTFGHHAYLPDVLEQGGVKYFYHCRGKAGHTLYRWRGQSGHELLTLCEPDWYNNTITGQLAARVPGFCQEHHIGAMLTVYGVGDHGGGPTDRDLARIEDMMTWPLFPTVEFSSFHAFFEEAEKARAHLPVVTSERNVMFSGCYTSQSRIKQGNLIAERMLYQAELFGAFAHLGEKAPYRRALLEDAWRKVLFNQFHDIVTGSGMAVTREYAMGQYQQVYAAAGMTKRGAYQAICANIDTSAFASEDEEDSTAEGSGAGFGVTAYKAGCVARGGARTRVFHLFNPLPYARGEAVPVTVWDCKDDPRDMEFVDRFGRPLRWQLIDQHWEGYWFNDVTRCLVQAEVPTCGYTTIALRPKQADTPVPIENAFPQWREEAPRLYTLENELLRVTLDPVTMRVCSVYDKERNEERSLCAGFDYIREDPSDGMTSWYTGRYLSVEPVGRDAHVKKDAWGEVRQAYAVSLRFGEASTLHYTVALDANSRQLTYDVDCDWREIGSDESVIPQLRFSVQMDKSAERFCYRAPGGLLHRDGEAQNKPSLGAIHACDLGLLCDSTYGFRGDGNEMSVALLRGSTSPDPIPERGHATCRIALALCGEEELSRRCLEFANPMDIVSGTAHAGQLPLVHSFVRLHAEHTELVGVKLAEDSDALIVHLNNLGEAESVTLELDAPVAKVSVVDALESELSPCPSQGATVALQLAARSITALKLTMGGEPHLRKD